MEGFGHAFSSVTVMFDDVKAESLAGRRGYLVDPNVVEDMPVLWKYCTSRQTDSQRLSSSRR